MPAGLVEISLLCQHSVPQWCVYMFTALHRQTTPLSGGARGTWPEDLRMSGSHPIARVCHHADVLAELPNDLWALGQGWCSDRKQAPARAGCARYHGRRPRDDRQHRCRRAVGDRCASAGRGAHPCGAGPRARCASGLAPQHNPGFGPTAINTTLKQIVLCYVHAAKSNALALPVSQHRSSSVWPQMRRPNLTNAGLHIMPCAEPPTSSVVGNSSP